jgi:hypothetical protein
MKFTDRFLKPPIIHHPKHFASNIFPEATLIPSNLDIVLWKSYIPVNGTIFIENQNLLDNNTAPDLDIDYSDGKLILTIQCSDGNDIVEIIEKGRQLMITSLNMENLTVRFEKSDNIPCVVKYGISIHN